MFRALGVRPEVCTHLGSVANNGNHPVVQLPPHSAALARSHHRAPVRGQYVADGNCVATVERVEKVLHHAKGGNDAQWQPKGLGRVELNLRVSGKTKNQLSGAADKSQKSNVCLPKKRRGP